MPSVEAPHPPRSGSHRDRRTVGARHEPRLARNPPDRFNQGSQLGLTLVATRLYQLLMCPMCGAAPEPGMARCRGCNPTIVAAGGALDRLDDGARVDAAMYAALLHYAPINDVIREARRVV